MKRNLFVSAIIASAIAWLVPLSAANAGHLGVKVWVAEPTIHDVDPATSSPNALRSDGLGRYPETTDTYAHINDYDKGSTYEDHFLLVDKNRTKRTVKLNIPGVTNGTVTCGTKAILEIYPWGASNMHWFNDLAQGASVPGYGYLKCRVTDGFIYDVVYPESTWCLEIRRLDGGTTDIGRSFRFSAPESCMASVTLSQKTGRDTWVITSYGQTAVPFDVDTVVTREIKSA